MSINDLNSVSLLYQFEVRSICRGVFLSSVVAVIKIYE